MTVPPETAVDRYLARLDAKVKSAEVTRQRLLDLIADPGPAEVPSAAKGKTEVVSRLSRADVEAALRDALAEMTRSGFIEYETVGGEKVRVVLKKPPTADHGEDKAG